MHQVHLRGKSRVIQWWFRIIPRVFHIDSGRILIINRKPIDDPFFIVQRVPGHRSGSSSVVLPQNQTRGIAHPHRQSSRSQHPSVPQTVGDTTMEDQRRTPPPQDTVHKYFPGIWNNGEPYFQLVEGHTPGHKRWTTFLDAKEIFKVLIEYKKSLTHIIPVSFCNSIHNPETVHPLIWSNVKPKRS